MNNVAVTCLSKLFKIFPVYFGVVFGGEYVESRIFQHFKKIDVFLVSLEFVLHKPRFTVFFYSNGKRQIADTQFFYFVCV